MPIIKKHIVFVIPSLAAGGAERIFAFLSQNLNTNLFKVTLLVIGHEHETVYDVSNTRVLYLNKSRILRGIPKLFTFLRKEQPDIVVSSIVHLNTLMAFMSLFFPKIKFIAREANILSILKNYNISWLLPKPLIVFSYKFFDKIIAQSKDMKRDMINNYNVKASKIALINNPITSNFTLKEKPTNEYLRFITVGRLSKEKGFDRLLMALKKLDFPFTYTIVGDGNEKTALFKLITNLGYLKLLI